jgi:hypothetical protein
VTIASRTSEWLLLSGETASGDAGCRMHALALSGLCELLAPCPAISVLRSELAGAAEEEDFDVADPLTCFFAQVASTRAGLSRAGIEVGGRLLVEAPSGRINRGTLTRLLVSGAPGHSRAVALVEEGTMHGALTLQANALCADLVNGVALAAARCGDLLLAARSVRVACYLGSPPHYFRQSHCRFFETIQQVDGSFLSSTQICRESRGSPSLRFILKAATSFHALWTLAELRTVGFRLMRTVPAGMAGLRHPRPDPV